MSDEIYDFYLVHVLFLHQELRGSTVMVILALACGAPIAEELFGNSIWSKTLSNY
jgi:hypothetical protein